MKKEEIFMDVLLAVSNATGLSEKQILNSKTEECTDARFILVRYLYKLIPISSIATMLKRTAPGIRCILDRPCKDSFWVESNWKEIIKSLESKYFITK